MLSFQQIGSTLISLKMIVDALQSELYKLMFYSLSSKILKILELNLAMIQGMIQILLCDIRYNESVIIVL